MKFRHLQNISKASLKATAHPISWWRPLSLRFKLLILATVACSLLAIVWITGSLNTNNSAETASGVPSSSPEFQTVLPSHTTIEQLGGWRRLDPPSGEPFYVYLDTIEEVSVTVSQQLLPRNFMENTQQQVANFAKDFGANSEISMEDGDKLYVGSSARGPQSAVLIKNGLLILIKSQQKIDDVSWKRYAESLQ